jgi:hypothetical protein
LSNKAPREEAVKTSATRPLIGRDNFFWRYFFDEKEILRVKVVPLRQFVGLYILLAAANVFTIFGSLYLPVPPTLGLLELILALVLPPIIVAWRWVRVEGSNWEDLAQEKTSTHIPWSAVRSARMKGLEIQIQTDTKLFKTFARRNDRKPIEALIVSKVKDASITQP